jgi:hypothetical protein
MNRRIFRWSIATLLLATFARKRRRWWRTEWDGRRSGGTTMTGGFDSVGVRMGKRLASEDVLRLRRLVGGFIRALEVRLDRTGPRQLDTDYARKLGEHRPVSFRMGTGDSMYVVMNRANAVYRFTPKTRTGAGCPQKSTSGFTALVNASRESMLWRRDAGEAMIHAA